MKLSEWARQAGVRYETAWKWFRDGILPVPATRLPTGTILVMPPAPPPASVALYARVSSPDQKKDLERQKARLVTYATERGHQVGRVVEEIGSGLNGHRSKLLSVLQDPNVGGIVVEHRDRLARFGSEYIEAALSSSGRRLIVMEEGEGEDDLVRDMTEILTSFCARLYGRRSAKKRAQRALEAAKA
ncbi:MAG: IS607 family transposase [Thermoplasmata archaeon]